MQHGGEHQEAFRCISPESPNYFFIMASPFFIILPLWTLAAPAARKRAATAKLRILII